MPRLEDKYYWRADDIPQKLQPFYQGYSKVSGHKLLGELSGTVYMKSNREYGHYGIATVDKYGKIHVNPYIQITSDEWAYVLAHCLLHLAFGHFDDAKIPKDDFNNFNSELWNKACDIYITRFLYDIDFGTPLTDDPADFYSIKLNDEAKIYEHLVYLNENVSDNSVLNKSDLNKKSSYSIYGTNGDQKDMLGLDKPIVYKNGEHNQFIEDFSLAINRSVSNAVHFAGGYDNFKEDSVIKKASNWFLTHYPLLGGLASSFKIIENPDMCYKYEIHIAAVDISAGEIYVNTSANLTEEEWKFVLAHEYLHAGLSHHKRCLGRNKYLWNVACDYVINDWLIEMQIGKMPEEGLLFDKDLHGYSAEAIYDIIIKEMRKSKKHATFRGFGHGDIMTDNVKGFASNIHAKGITLDEFFKNALKEGLDFHNSNNRGYLPAGLIEEIKALSTPPIPWEVELGNWFDINFPPLEKHRTYARPSRRQGATPDIPRPRYVLMEEDKLSRTFGVVIDTSGSMSTKQIGLALGAIASYAVSKDVPLVRVVFCDADAYDAGYMTPYDVAGKVKIIGRGGTILQPAITLLEKAKDFPKDGPILIITDGYIENRISIHIEHAYLLPKGNKLPFNPKGKVFYFK
ncbi:MAG: hypothetical protein IJA34_03125 [Lachnospiraceae bacterium]|nr:hypothetical protein [Lachnospiraceae bacterium]